MASEPRPLLAIFRYLPFANGAGSVHVRAAKYKANTFLGIIVCELLCGGMIMNGNIYVRTSVGICVFLCLHRFVVVYLQTSMHTHTHTHTRDA